MKGDKSAFAYGFNGYIPIGNPVDIQDKVGAVRYYTSMMIDRTQGIFKYTGLPETIPERMLELYLQTKGFVCIGEHEGKLYAFFGALGGMPDEYYRPTICTVNNPALKLSRMFKIDEDCVIIKNDCLLTGLLPMFNRYATLIAENDVTIRIAEINARLVDLISASDDRTYKSAVEFLKEIEKGNLGVIAESAFLDGVKSQPYASSGSTNTISQLIELQQYLKASWMNDIGLSANYNMKRESINSGEAQLGEDSMMTLIDNMLKERKLGIEKVNAMFGTEITVELNNVWAKKEQAEDTEIAILENEEENADEGVENPVENVENSEEQSEDKEVTNDEGE